MLNFNTIFMGQALANEYIKKEIKSDNLFTKEYLKNYNYEVKQYLEELKINIEDNMNKEKLKYENIIKKKGEKFEKETERQNLFFKDELARKKEIAFNLGLSSSLTHMMEFSSVDDPRKGFFYSTTNKANFNDLLRGDERFKEIYGQNIAHLYHDTYATGKFFNLGTDNGINEFTKNITSEKPVSFFTQKGDIIKITTKNRNTENFINKNSLFGI